MKSDTPLISGKGNKAWRTQQTRTGPDFQWGGIEGVVQSPTEEGRGEKCMHKSLTIQTLGKERGRDIEKKK